ncbi:threonine ammonia-lyase [Geomesophilobacter sediminis]|uniref:Threonine ammonia-lyase n=1 Tax=Geomesophilobacter sediminis TaxID=2798584 RepID=A0A8J7JK98_9BACT|nr:threonine ammonia-lyase [Geomesophilobacter sediminis]MBJ6724875.1 threonine ammonia-lyase [Geomesophilobacter sediminis]
MLDYDLILDAATRLKKRVRRTELIHAHHFSERLGLPLYLKCENLQRTGAFKIRGAMNFMAAQPRSALAGGVITASAGNHAQGVAFSADLLGVKSTVYMPETTPPQKVFSTRDYGAEVVLEGKNFDEACSAALTRSKETGALFVHPFDDPLVMAGQGTIGLELLEDLPDLANVLVPIGGGGLIAGIAMAIKETHPHVRVIGVESAAAPSMQTAIKKGKVVTVPIRASLADGIAVKTAGSETYPVVRDLVDEIVLVEEEEIALAIVSLLERNKLMVEGAGAVGVAALLNRKVAKISGKTVALLSGGNIDVKTIAVVVERGMLAAGRYLKLKVELDDVPGALARLSTEIAEARANISIITHDRRSESLPIGKTEVLVELETRGPDHIREVISHLESKGYKLIQ